MIPSGIDWYVPHQVNRSLTQKVAEHLGFAPEKQIYTLHKYGSMAGASILSALHEGLSSGQIQPGQLIAFNTVGGGLTWSALVWRV